MEALQHLVVITQFCHTRELFKSLLFQLSPSIVFSFSSSGIIFLTHFTLIQKKKQFL